MDYPEQYVRVGPSPNGLGVFSLRELTPNEAIGPIEGKTITDAGYESDYCMELGEHSALEPAPPFRYVNHSCHPNCELIEVGQESDVEGVRLWLKVTAVIAPGEELTIDYAWPARVATPCNCGCPDCRHWIVDADQLDKVLRI
jgi:hypothetical protein